jgi:hypothetical protein
MAALSSPIAGSKYLTLFVSYAIYKVKINTHITEPSIAAPLLLKIAKFNNSPIINPNKEKKRIRPIWVKSLLVL